MANEHEKMFYVINFQRNADENLTATRMQVNCKYMLKGCDVIWNPHILLVTCKMIQLENGHFFRWLKVEMLLSCESTCVCIANRNKIIYEKGYTTCSQQTKQIHPRCSSAEILSDKISIAMGSNMDDLVPRKEPVTSILPIVWAHPYEMLSDPQRQDEWLSRAGALRLGRGEWLPVGTELWSDKNVQKLR